MNTRLQKSFGFYCGLVYEGNFTVNHYNLQLDLTTVSADHREQNIAYERMKYWIYSVLDDSILIAHDDPLLSIYQQTGARLIVLPSAPVDQIMGIMLYLKLNAIMENRIVVTDTEIWSTQGDHMSYLHSHGEGLGVELAQPGWWIESGPIWYNPAQADSAEKVVNLESRPEWKDHELDWQQDDGEERSSVVFAKFPKNENK